MAYVAMTRGRHSNQAYLYHQIDQRPTRSTPIAVAAPEIHLLRRGNRYSAARHFRQILGNDERPRTMHAEAEQTDPALATRPSRRCPRTPSGAPPRPRHRLAGPPRSAQSWQAGYERMAAAATQARATSIEIDAGLEF